MRHRDDDDDDYSDSLRWADMLAANDDTETRVAG